MQPLNDDMQELFRRAAEEYPLNTDGSDWDKVMQQLHHKEGVSSKGETRKKEYRYLWLLFLLPIGFVCGRYVGNDKNVALVEANKGLSTPALPHSGTTTSTPGVATVKPKANDRKEQSVTGIKNTVLIPGKVASTKRNSTTSSNVNKLAEIKPIGALAARTAISDNALANSRKKRYKSPSFNKRSTQLAANIVNGNEKDIVARADGAKATATVEESSTVVDTSLLGNTVEKDTAKTAQAGPTPAATKGSKKLNTFKKTFSYSIVAGGDISTIKYQKTSSVGYNLGFTLRYQFAESISVEAGALWARKNYYTAGEYLDTGFLKLPSHSTVKTAAGYCNMIEIPINIRYDFSASQKRTWFIAGGLSSYLMFQEDYDITYERYNMPYIKNYGYSHSTKDWFAIMNLSIGYQKSLSKRTNISIAPYVKLPLRGIGIGKLPISSTGIFLSLSRSFK
jgi:hypothetical protein